ncbi:hypothetical protein EON65_30480 [archaeon]|nr:MAG: hypothetical protein EON65_30480 [archaeon]
MITAQFLTLSSFKFTQIEEKKQRRYEDRESMRESAAFNGDINQFDHAEHEHFATEQVERYHERAKLDQSRRRRSRTGSSKSLSEDGFSDERAIYYMSQIRKKASLVAHHLETITGKLSEDEMHDLNRQIVEYIEKEKIVGAYVQRTADEFNKARDIEDRDKRLKYLDKVKKARDDRLGEERAAREMAREHYLQIRAKIDPILYPKDL